MVLSAYLTWEEHCSMAVCRCIVGDELSLSVEGDVV